MTKQAESCIFCDQLPCECDGPVKPKKVRVRQPKPEPATEAALPGRRRASRSGRVDDLTPALRVLNFHGMLAPEEKKKYAKQLELKPTGKLKEV